MKKIFTLLCAALSISAFGQFNTGSIYFTGMTDFSTGLVIESSEYQEIPGENQTVGYIPLSFQLEGGYFIKNKLALGADIAVNDIAFRLWGIYDNYNAHFHFGPNIRYYFPTDENWQMYAFGSIFYGFEYGGHNLAGFKFGPGVNYFFNESIALDARFSYMYKNTFNREFGGSHNNHQFLFELGISVFFPSLTFWDRS